MALVTAVIGATVTGTAAAQEPSPSPGPNPNPTPPSKSDFQLNPSKHNGSFPDRIAKLDKELPKLGVQNILEQVSRQAKCGDDCESPAFKDMTPRRSGTASTARTPASGAPGELVRQGWHRCGKGVRVSFLDPATKKYQHVLPTAASGRSTCARSSI
ncbi:hypothetical protein [Amycolatopsis anabasis]|uniref:hypothetical protein n=1 Tax=Amycolatopsis anabasis TaxID=1840409 RepID=UPI001C555164|nr:hypothetical protein [Amycolatopsis anabasis]